jgi:hypothetical protein
MKKLIILLFFVVSSIVTYSQIDFYEHPEKKKDTTLLFERKLLFGGDFGIGVGDSYWIKAAPQISYPLNNWFAPGMGFEILYYSYGNNYKSIIYGPNAYLQFFALNFLVFQIEGQILNTEDYSSSAITKRIWVPAFYLGLGYKQNLSKKSYVSYVFLWDFLQTSNSVYSNPTYRVRFYF